jgi:hypothetical protein
LLLLSALFLQMSLSAQTKPDKENDTLPNLPYQFKSHQKGSLFLNLPLSKEVVYEKEVNRYVIRENSETPSSKHRFLCLRKNTKTTALNKTSATITNKK